mmetsp:Transcript_16095/g.21067  ORF Transcript_16095/g.21067 Transcript_16095/m.21067 type:complete len:1408 (+) Transcript_16095:1398-5621(+)
MDLTRIASLKHLPIESQSLDTISMSCRITDNGDAFVELGSELNVFKTAGVDKAEAQMYFLNDSKRTHQVLRSQRNTESIYDTGASYDYVSEDDPRVLQDTVFDLPRPHRIQQGTVKVLATKAAIFTVVLQDARYSRGLVYVTEAVLVPGFKSGLVLLAPSTMQASNIALIDARHKPYCFLDDGSLPSAPLNGPKRLPAKVPSFLCFRGKSKVLCVNLCDPQSFDSNLWSLRRNATFDLTKDIAYATNHSIYRNNQSSAAHITSGGVILQSQTIDNVSVDDTGTSDLQDRSPVDTSALHGSNGVDTTSGGVEESKAEAELTVESDKDETSIFLCPAVLATFGTYLEDFTELSARTPEQAHAACEYFAATASLMPQLVDSCYQHTDALLASDDGPALTELFNVISHNFKSRKPMNVPKPTIGKPSDKAMLESDPPDSGENESSYPSMIDASHEKFSEKLFNVWWFVQIFPEASPSQMERNILANPGICNLESGDSRYLKFLAPDRRRSSHLKNRSKLNKKEDRLDKYIGYAPGEIFSFDAAIVTTAPVYGKYKCYYLFGDPLSDYGIFHAGKDLTTRESINSVVFAVNLIKILFQIHIKVLVTDAAKSLIGESGDYLRAQLGIQFHTLGRYDAHFGNFVEQKIGRVTFKGNTICMNLYGTYVNSRRLKPESYWIYSYPYTIYSGNHSASTLILKLYGVNRTPTQLLSGIVDRVTTLLPFGERVLYNQRDLSKQKPRTMEALVLCPVAFTGFFGESRLVVNEREWILQDIVTGKFFVSAEFQPLVFRPEFKQHQMVRLANTATSTDPFRPQRLEIDQTLEMDSTPIFDLDDIEATPVEDALRNAEPVDVSPGDLSDPVVQSLANNNPNVPDIINSAFPPPELDSVESPSAGLRQPSSRVRYRQRRAERRKAALADLPPPRPAEKEKPPTKSQRKPQTVYHRAPKINDFVDCFFPHDGSWTRCQIIKSTRDIGKKPLFENGVRVPAQDTFLIMDLVDPERQVYTKYMTRELHGTTWRYAADPKPNQKRPAALRQKAGEAFVNRHEALLKMVSDDDLTKEVENERSTAIFSKILDSDATFLGVLTISNDTRPIENDEKTASGLKFAYNDSGESTEDDTGVPLMSQFLDPVPARPNSFDELPDSVQATMNSYGQATTAREFKQLGGTAAELKLAVESQAIVVDPTSVEGDLFREVVTAHIPKECVAKLRISGARIRTELADCGFYMNDADDPMSWAEIGTCMFDCSEAGVALGTAIKHKKQLFSGSFDHLFGQNVDPNLDLVEQLKDYDLSKVEGLFLAFDPHLQAKGEGKVLGKDDFTYLPEKILELRNVKDPDEKRKMLAAILKEFQGLGEKGVFRLALVPEGRNSIPLKIVLKVKFHADGSYTSTRLDLWCLVICQEPESIGIARTLQRL